MLARLTDYEPAFEGFDLFDQFRRQMERVLEGERESFAANSGLRLNVFDVGSTLRLEADLPGLTEKDVQITLDDGVLTLTGERRIEAPKGFKAHRQERRRFRFSRSIALPLKVDPEKTSAQIKDGVLTVTLTKAPEARPRQITVRAAS